MNAQFMHAIRDAEEFASNNIVFSVGAFAREVADDARFEPLQEHSLINVTLNGKGLATIGYVKPVQMFEKFQRMVSQSETYDFNEVHHRCLRLMKNGIESQISREHQTFINRLWRAFV